MALRSVITLLAPVGAKGPRARPYGRSLLPSPSGRYGFSSMALWSVITLLTPIGDKGPRARSYGQLLYSQAYRGLEASRCGQWMTLVGLPHLNEASTMDRNPEHFTKG